MSRPSDEVIDANIPGAFPVTSPSISSERTLAQSVYARRAEYTRPKTLRVKVGTWNVAAFKGPEDDLQAWFVDGTGAIRDFAGLALGDRRQGLTVAPDENEDPKSAENKVDQAGSPHGHESVSHAAQEEVGLYALGLQELVDISSPAEALRPYTDPSAAKRYKKALDESLPEGYKLIAEQQLFGLLLLVYASPTIAAEVQSVGTTSVGTGLMGYMGNKGAVVARVVLGETTRIVFVNSHLAAGADKAALDRRNWDAGQILSRVKLDPITDAAGVTQTEGDAIGDEDFAFWFGDLNYRLEGIPGDDVRRLLMLHSQNLDEGGLHQIDPTTEVRGTPQSASSTDDSRSQSPSKQSAVTEESAETNITEPSPASPASVKNSLKPPDVDAPASENPAHVQNTIAGLLPHDELMQQQKAKKAFHDGWKEGGIEFLPTYKYDAGTLGVFDSSDKRRCPSWCDRILYRSRGDKLAYEASIKEEEESRKRDEEMKSRGLEQAAEDEDVLFDYDPDADGDEPQEDVTSENGAVAVRGISKGEVLLDRYAAYQHVLSSDHKPLDAVFRLSYDSVVPELKARVHADVVRDLDRAENEGRPAVTVIIDGQVQHESDDQSDEEQPSTEALSFGGIKYAQRKRRSLTVANTGRVSASIGLVDHPTGQGQQHGSLPGWLTSHFDRNPSQKLSTPPEIPEMYTLEPGDACNVEFMVWIRDMTLVRPLNDGEMTLDDVLVLRVFGGRDHFIPVHARWLPTSFGRSIDKLIRLPEGGVRKMQRRRRRQKAETRSRSHSGHAGGGSPDSSRRSSQDAVQWSAPRELFRLTEAVEELLERSLAEWDMTASTGDRAPWEASAGWPFDSDSWTLVDESTRERLCLEIRETLDRDKSFNENFVAGTPSLQRLEAISETLIAFLESLEDGVITEDDWIRLDAGISVRDKSSQKLSLEEEKSWILEILSSSPSHNVSFMLLTSMLARTVTTAVSAVKIGPDATPRPSAEIPPTPQTTGRSKRLSATPESAGREIREATLAALFANIIIRSPAMAKAKDKEKRVCEDRKIHVVEVFLKES